MQAGWQAKLNPLGSTIFWGQYLETNYGAGIASLQVQAMRTDDVLNSLGNNAFIAGSQTKTWSSGLHRWWMIHRSA